MPPKKQNDHKPEQLKPENRPPAGGAASHTPQAMGPTNYARQQSEEVEALASIYLDDFKADKGKSAAWGKAANISFDVCLRATSDALVSATLSVELPATYPKTVPILKIKELQSGNASVPSKLQNILDKKPKELLGDVMIYHLCTLLQDVLEEAAITKAENEGLGNLEEERAALRAAAQHAASEQEQALILQKEKEIAEKQRLLEVEVSQERARQEKLLPREMSTANAHRTDEMIGPQTSLNLVTFDQPMFANDTRDRGSITFSTVLGGPIISKTKDKKMTTVHPVTSGDWLVPQMLLKDIYLIENKSETVKFRQEIHAIEELLVESKKRRHPHVVDLVGYKVYRSVTTDPIATDQAATWELSILSEHANKGSLLELLEMTGSLAAQKVRSWTHQILDALEFFDKNNYVHPAVHAGNILLFRSPGGAINVKLSDGYGTLLKDLVVQTKERAGLAENAKSLWTAPELGRTPISRTNKTCIWDLGVVILQMVFGKDVTTIYTSPTNCITGTELSIPLEDLLERVFQPESNKRPRAFELTSSAFIRDDDGPLVSSNSPMMPSTPHRRLRHGSTVHSRFEKEWDESERLGKGGFGEVVKARNRKDGRIYAVKKVICESGDDLEFMNGEVKLLAGLNHPNVVRYFNSWDDSNESLEMEDLERSDTDSRNIQPSLDADPFALPSIGHDFMSSGIYRGIQFGDSDDEDVIENGDDDPLEEESKAFSSQEDNDAQEATDTQAQLLRRRESRALQDRPKKKITLYIVMEYCENYTLRTLIKQGSLLEDVAERWRLFRQIVEGLAHIHDNAVVHRDLKPDNIFISKNNNVRIGDFGLATTGHFTATSNNSATLAAGPGTRSIGTIYYVAPELSSRGSGVYSSKVDMYSLGIILFEMCVALQTTMERDRQLRMIRNRIHALPPTFQSPELALQGEIILVLLCHNPERRPSAIDLLASGKIPEPIEDEKIRRYILDLSESNSLEYRKLVSTLFSQPPRKARELAWYRKPEPSTKWLEPSLDTSIRDKIVTIFRRHGAVPVHRPTIFPQSEYYPAGAAVTFLDPSGVILQLPYDLTFPFARLLATETVEHRKVYTFGDVYRPSVEGSEPLRLAEVDFDIVSRNALDLPLKEAEAIKVLDEIVTELPTLRSKRMRINVSHSDLLDTIFEYCRIKPDCYFVVRNCLSRLNIGKYNWKRLQNDLRSPSINVPATSLDELSKFDFHDDANIARVKLEQIFKNTDYTNRVSQNLFRIESVINYLERFQVRTKVLISPLSNSPGKIYQGYLMIQCMNESQKKVIAVGGRYDTLIRDQYSRPIANQARAFGFRLSLAEILAAENPDLRKVGSAKYLKTAPAESAVSDPGPKCDVLVASFDGAILRTTGIEIIQQLWGHGISSELADDAETMEELMLTYKNDLHSWIVIIRSDTGAIGERAFKARNGVTGEETDLVRKDLIPWLRHEIRERADKASESSQLLPRLRRETSFGESASHSTEVRDTEIKVLSSQHRSKKANRHQMIEAATTKTRELVESFLGESPVLAIETSDEVLEKMRNTRLAQPDSWRELSQSAPVQERRYLQQAQDALQEWARAGKKGVFVFNHRTGACIYYDLGSSA